MFKFLSSLSIATIIGFSLLTTNSNAKTELTNGNVSISHDCGDGSGGKHPCPKPTPKVKEETSKHDCGDGSGSKHPCPKPTPKAKEDTSKHDCGDGSGGKHPCPKPTPTPKP